MDPVTSLTSVEPLCPPAGLSGKDQLKAMQDVAKVLQAANRDDYYFLIKKIKREGPQALFLRFIVNWTNPLQSETNLDKIAVELEKNAFQILVKIGSLQKEMKENMS